MRPDEEDVCLPAEGVACQLPLCVASQLSSSILTYNRSREGDVIKIRPKACQTSRWRPSKCLQPSGNDGAASCLPQCCPSSSSLLSSCLTGHDKFKNNWASELNLNPAITAVLPLCMLLRLSPSDCISCGPQRLLSVFFHPPIKPQYLGLSQAHSSSVTLSVKCVTLKKI